MALYLFDTDDGTEFLHDGVGVELPNLDAARREATTALAEIAKDIIPGSEQRELTLIVRTETGKPILRLTISFDITADFGDGE